MSHYPHQPVVLIPASRLAAFNAIMERNGYGPNFAWQEVIGKTAAINSKPAFYVVESACDNGLSAAIMAAAKVIPGVRVTRAGRGRKRANEVLGKEGLKTKRQAKNAAANRSPRR